MSANPNIRFSSPFDWAAMPALVYPGEDESSRVISILQNEDGGAEVWRSAVEPGSLSVDALNIKFRQEVPGAAIIDIRDRDQFKLVDGGIQRAFTVVLEQVVRRPADQTASPE